MENSSKNVELFAARSYPGHRGISIYGDSYDERGRAVCAVHSPVYEQCDEFSHCAKPLVTLGEEAAQKLFQSLWDMGCRPKSQDGNIGMLQATQDHLKDMRELVSSCLGVTL